MDKVIKYLPAIVISLFTIRATIFGAGIGDAIAILGALSLHGYDKFLATKIIPEPTKEMQEEIKKLKNEITTVSVAVSQRAKPAPVSFKF